MFGRGARLGAMLATPPRRGAARAWLLTLFLVGGWAGGAPGLAAGQNAPGHCAAPPGDAGATEAATPAAERADLTIGAPTGSCDDCQTAHCTASLHCASGSITVLATSGMSGGTTGEHAGLRVVIVVQAASLFDQIPPTPPPNLLTVR